MSLDGHWRWLKVYEFPSYLHGMSLHHSHRHCSTVQERHRSLGEKSRLQISPLTTRLQSDDPVLSGGLAALHSCLQRWKTPTRRKKSIPFYKAFKLVLRSLDSEEIRSCVSQNPFSPLLAKASFDPRSSISFIQVNMLLHKGVGKRAMHHCSCLGRTKRELLKGYRYSGWGGLANLCTSSWVEPNHFGS